MCQYNNIYKKKKVQTEDKKKKRKKKKRKVPHQSTVTATVLAQCKHFECIVPKHCSGYWRLLCQYNNIYAGSYKYLKEKKSTNGRQKKKREQSASPKHCYRYSACTVQTLRVHSNEAL